MKSAYTSVGTAHGWLGWKENSRQDSSRIFINEIAAFRAEVHCDKEAMARNTNDSRHRCIFDSIFSGKTEGIESNTPQ